MRVAIDATPLLLRSAGVKTYVYEWIRHLRRLASGDAVLAFPFLGAVDGYSHEKSVVGRTQTLLRLALVHAANHSRLPLLDLVCPRVDVFHASHQLYNPPRRCKLTATVYDMTCWIVPETHPPWNIKGSRRFAESVLRRADGLIAISESTRADAIRILNLPEEKIEVIYPGIPEAYFRVTSGEATAAAERYGLSRPYILFVGTVEPRKNLDALLDAWQLLAPSLRDEFEMVVAGPAGWAPPETVARLRSRARYLGYVPEADLPAITAGAAVFVYPSLYEGFGFPVAQAMAAGVPVVTSNVSSLPEVTAGAALLVDPRSPAEIRTALERLLSDPELRRRLASAGATAARRFTWEECARRSLAFLRRISEA